MSSEWKVETKRSLLRRLPWLEVFQEAVRLPDGRAIDDFYTIAIPEYVVVAGLDDQGNILVERHYRHGARTVTWSLPSGYVDPGELADEAARRELREETGFEAESWETLGRYVVDGNRGCGWANLLLAFGIHRVGLPDGNDLASVEVELLPFGEVMASLADGRVAELATAAALALVSIRRAGVL